MSLIGEGEKNLNPLSPVETFSADLKIGTDTQTTINGISGSIKIFEIALVRLKLLEKKQRKISRLISKHRDNENCF